mgnify:CR=1 FL=1
MDRKVFLAGATGAIGKRLVPLLLDAGYGSFRHDSLREQSRWASSRGRHANCGRRVRCAGVVSSDCCGSSGSRIHQLTDLPADLEPSRMAEGIARTTRIRTEGTRNLVTAALESGARRLIAAELSLLGLRARATTLF